MVALSLAASVIGLRVDLCRIVTLVILIDILGLHCATAAGMKKSGEGRKGRFGF